jgi:hypothetical protein
VVVSVSMCPSVDPLNACQQNEHWSTPGLNNHGATVASPRVISSRHGAAALISLPLELVLSCPGSLQFPLQAISSPILPTIYPNSHELLRLLSHFAHPCSLLSQSLVHPITIVRVHTESLPSMCIMIFTCYSTSLASYSETQFLVTPSLYRPIICRRRS